MLLDVEKYRPEIDARNARLKAAAQFREPDRVPVTFSMAGSYYCGLFDYPIADYYANPELQVEVQLKGLEWEFEYLRADSCTKTSIGYDMGPLGEWVICGGDVERPAGTSPRYVHRCATLDDFLALEIPRPADNPRFGERDRAVARFTEAARKLGVRLTVRKSETLHAHPPLSFLCAVVDPVVVCTAMYTEPEKLRAALDKCFDAFLTYREIGVADSKKIASLGIADDNISFISGAAFREWELPYYVKLRQRYNLASFHLHTDGPNDQHFRILAEESGLTSMDIGGFSDLANAVRDMKGRVHISGGLNCKDFYAKGPMPDATRRKALAALRLAGPGGGFQLAIGGETYVGVSPQGIRELVELVESRGRYPIRIAEAEVK